MANPISSPGAVVVPVSTLRCPETAFGDLHYAPSDGGPCGVPNSLDAFLP